MGQAAIGSFDTLNPLSIKGNAAKGLDLVTDRLMARVWDEPFTLYPLIAEKVDVPEDRSSLTVFVNPKARFHDGTPITADDVLFSYETLKAGGRPNMRRIYQLATHVGKLDERTVKFSFGPGHDRETVMIFAMMPVVSKAWWTGKTFDSTTLEIPLGNGPYKVVSIDPGRKITLERVKDYWAADLLPNKGHNNFDRIVYDYFRDDTVAFESFKSGGLNVRREWDVTTWHGGYDFPALKDGRVRQESLRHGRPDRVRAFIFNTRRPPFDDIRVRRALNLAFDFEWVNRSLFHDQYERIASYFPNTNLAATGTPSAAELDLLAPWKDKLSPDIFGPAYAPPRNATPAEKRENLLKADALLKEAGWSVVNGVRMKDGQPFSFEILLDNPNNEKTALAFVRNIERLGIKANIRVLDNAAYLDRLRDYSFDMTLYYWLSTLSPGTEQYLYWSCEAAKQPSRWNYAGVCNPAADALSQNIAKTTTREGLIAHVRALDRILTHGEYMIPLYINAHDYIASWAEIRRPETIPLYGPVLETWWAEPQVRN